MKSILVKHSLLFEHLLTKKTVLQIVYIYFGRSVRFGHIFLIKNKMRTSKQSSILIKNFPSGLMKYSGFVPSFNTVGETRKLVYILSSKI